MLLISEKLALNLLEPRRVRDVVMETLRAHAKGHTGLSDPRSQFLRTGADGSYYHIKGAFLADRNIAGFRVNGLASGAGAQRHQSLLLTDLKSTRPLALVSAEGLSARRVGAAVAVSVELLRKSSATSLALVGAGSLASAAAIAVQRTTPVSHLRVVARQPASAQRLCRDLQAEGISGAEAFSTLEEACAGADIMVTMTSADQALIKAAWCKPGSLLVTAGGRRECESKAILGADKIFVDDWEQCITLGDLAALYREGKLSRENITGTLSDLLVDSVAGRQSDNERIVAVPQGLAVLDVALAHLAYQLAREQGLGDQVEWP